MGTALPFTPPDAPPPPPPATGPATPATPAEADGPVVDATYRMTAGDLYRVSAAATRHSRIAGVFGFFAIWNLVIGLVSGDAPSIVGSLVFGVGFGVGILPGAISAFFGSRRPEILRREIHLHADAAGVRMASPGSMSEFTWATLRRVRPMGDDYLLDFGTGAATFIPRHALNAADRAALERLVLAHGELDLANQWRWLALGCGLGLGLSLLFLLVTGYFSGY